MTSVLLGLTLAACFIAGCRTTGLDFVKDTSFRITTPDQSSSVSLPLVVRWTASQNYKPGYRYAVFLDRGTIGVGENISSLIPQSCTEDSTCSRSAYLAQQNVWVTPERSIGFRTLPSTSLTGSSSGREDHSLTVVLLDHTGTRVGEGDASTTFVFNRKNG